MPPRVITLDTLIDGKITITRNTGEDAVLTAEYDVQGGGFSLHGVFVPTLTPAQQTQINNLWNAVANAARNREGL